jgi:Carboxypeptidase regulatory-like domain
MSDAENDIGGYVTDSSGKALAGATVTVKNTATAAVLTTKTGSDGAYGFGNLQSGTYTVTVSMTGYHSASMTVSAGGSQECDFELASSSQTVSNGQAGGGTVQPTPIPGTKLSG